MSKFLIRLIGSEAQKKRKIPRNAVGWWAIRTTSAETASESAYGQTGMSLFPAPRVES